MIDARDHGWTRRRHPDEPYVDPTLSTSSMKAFIDDYLGLLLPFFEHHVRGVGDFDAAPVRWRVADAWHEAATWPPPEVATQRRHLTDELTLSPAPGGAVAAGWRHDPASPVPSRTHPYYPLVEPTEESGLLQRPDVLTFTGAPTPEPTVLLGPASLALDLQPQPTTGMVVATLYDVTPTGAAYRIADGASHVAAGAATLAIDLGHLGYRLDVGHRLALRLSSSSFPRYLLHPGNDTDPWTTTAFDVADYTVTRGTLTYATHREAAS